MSNTMLIRVKLLTNYIMLNMKANEVSEEWKYDNFFKLKTLDQDFLSYICFLLILFKLI